jgi:hypothetical protein
VIILHLVLHMVRFHIWSSSVTLYASQDRHGSIQIIVPPYGIGFPHQFALPSFLVVYPRLSSKNLPFFLGLSASERLLLREALYKWSDKIRKKALKVLCDNDSLQLNFYADPNLDFTLDSNDSFVHLVLYPRRLYLEGKR